MFSEIIAMLSVKNNHKHIERIVDCLQIPVQIFADTRSNILSESATSWRCLMFVMA